METISYTLPPEQDGATAATSSARSCTSPPTVSPAWPTRRTASPSTASTPAPPRSCGPGTC